jgi:hypothetical protein
MEWDMRPLKYRPGAYRKILMALVTAIKSAFASRDFIAVATHIGYNDNNHFYGRL